MAGHRLIVLKGELGDLHLVAAMTVSMIQTATTIHCDRVIELTRTASRTFMSHS
jgi:hypothetical protein